MMKVFIIPMIIFFSCKKPISFFLNQTVSSSQNSLQLKSFILEILNSLVHEVHVQTAHVGWLFNGMERDGIVNGLVF